MADNSKPVSDTDAVGYREQQTTQAGGNPDFFNPSLQSQPPSFTGYSRGADAPHSQQFSSATGYKNGDFLNSIGNIWKLGVDAIDQSLKVGIRNDLAESVQGVRDNDLAGVGSGAVPSDLQSTADKMGKITKAAQTGQMSDVHYWALMDYYTRQMKMRWGGPNGATGYSEFIDETIHKLTGSNPANALRHSLMEAGKPNDDMTKWRMNYEKENESIIGAKIPGYYDPSSKNYRANVTLDQLQNVVSGAKATEYKVQQATSRISLAQSAGTLQKSDADREAQTVVESAYNEGITAAVGLPGDTIDLNKIEEAHRKAAADGVISQDEDTQIRAMMGEYENAAMKRLDFEMQKPRNAPGEAPWTLSERTSPDFWDKTRTSWKQRIGVLRDKMLDKDTGGLVLDLAAASSARLRDEDRVIIANDEVRIATAQTKALGPLAPLAITGTKMDKLVKGLGEQDTKKVFLFPNTALKDLYGRIDARTKMTPEERAQVGKGELEAALNGIADPKMADGYKAQAIENIYGPGNEGFIETTVSPTTSSDPNKDTGAGRNLTLAQVAAPSVLNEAKALADRTGDPQVWETAKGGVLKAAATQIRRDAGTVNSALTNANGLEIRVNPNTYRFEYRQTNPIDGTLIRAGKQETDALDRANMTIGSVVNVMKAEGATPEEINQGVASFLGSVGIDPNAPKQLSPMQWLANKWNQNIEEANKARDAGTPNNAADKINQELRGEWEAIRSKGVIGAIRDRQKSFGINQLNDAWENNRTNNINRNVPNRAYLPDTDTMNLPSGEVARKAADGLFYVKRGDKYFKVNY